MYKLIAGAATDTFNGEVASRVFDNLDDAEKMMRDWARFGVENLCDEANSLRIFDAKGQLVKTWSRREKRAV